MTVESRSERAFVLGLDGVPWQLIERWTADGSLPHLTRLVKEGASGPLESTMPPTTAVAWPSIATSVGPDYHGIYSFRQLTSQYQHNVNTSDDRQAPAVWNMLSPAIVANVPMTYPAENIEGQLVAGMMTPSFDHQFTQPASLTQEITEEIPDYQIGLDWSSYEGREDAFLSDLETLLSARRSLMRKLMTADDWRLFFFVYTEPDRLQHLIWDENVIHEHYQQLDEIVGEVMAYVEEHHATLYVISDHGFGPIDGLVHANHVLATHGLLTPATSGSRNLLESLGITKDSVLGLSRRLGLTEERLKKLPAPLLDRVAANVPGGHSLYDVDFEDTQAFVYGGRCVYVNDTERFEAGTVPPSEVAQVKDAVIDAFASIRHPQTGAPLLDTYDGETLFPADPDSPDLVVASQDEYLVDTGVRGPTIAPKDRDGAHHREGIMLAWGPDIVPTHLDGATVFDVIPTLLHGVGEPIPKPTNGDVLTECFAPNSVPATREVTTKAVERGDGRRQITGDFTEVEGRLRGLGYIE